MQTGAALSSAARLASMRPDDKTDRDTVEDMIEACSDIIASTHAVDYEDFLARRERRQATVFCIAVLGEAVKRLSSEFRTRHADVPWQSIAGMRDRLIHGYDNIDYVEVWKSSTVDVPPLLERLRAIQAGIG